MSTDFEDYAVKLSDLLRNREWADVEKLADALFDAWGNGSKVLLCGNGGSAGNAIHLANDFLYGVGGGRHPGLNVEALPANPAVLTCLANDVGYESIFASQIEVKGAANDLLIILSGSGNSENVVNALKIAKDKGLNSFAILGFDGGVCKDLADHVIHLGIEDMQISEDFQLIVGHMCMQYLSQRINRFPVAARSH